MLQKILANKTNSQLLAKSVQASMLRHKTIAHNIANVTTPGFKRSEVSFEEEMQMAMGQGTRLKGRRTSSKHMALGKGQDIADINAVIYKPNDPTLPSGVNNVDIDMEMAKLAENQIAYSMRMRFMKGVYNKMNHAVMGRSMMN